MTLDIDDAPSEEEIERSIRDAQLQTKRWRGRTGWALVCFAVSCGFVVLISDLGPLHAQWRAFGLATIVVWLGLLLVLVYCGALWWGSWDILRGLEKTFRSD